MGHRPEPLSEGDLNDLERRLSAWKPSASARGRDRFLFEAGRASAQTGPRGVLTTAVLIALAAGLGGWGFGERSRRGALELTRSERSRAPVVALDERPIPPAPTSIPAGVPDPESYLALSRRLAAAAPDDRPTAFEPPINDPRPAIPGRSLTPLNARRPGGLVDL